MERHIILKEKNVEQWWKEHENIDYIMMKISGHGDHKYLVIFNDDEGGE